MTAPYPTKLLDAEGRDKCPVHKRRYRMLGRTLAGCKAEVISGRGDLVPCPHWFVASDPTDTRLRQGAS